RRETGWFLSLCPGYVGWEKTAAPHQEAEAENPRGHPDGPVGLHRWTSEAKVVRSHRESRSLCHHPVDCVFWGCCSSGRLGPILAALDPEGRLGMLCLGRSSRALGPLMRGVERPTHTHHFPDATPSAGAGQDSPALFLGNARLL